MYHHTGLRRLRRRLHRITKLPPRELLTTLHALAVLVVVELLIHWVRLPRLAQLLGVKLDLAPAAPLSTARPIELSPRSARRIRAADRVAVAWPFSEGPCLRKSLVVAHLLRNTGIAVRIGVAGAGVGLRAHAWVEIYGQPLEDVSEFTVLQAGVPPSVA